MKKQLAFCLALVGIFFGLLTAVSAQSEPLPFAITLEEMELPEAPALQSFAHANAGPNCLLVGGKTNGLHDHRPPFSFLPETRNTQLFVVNLETAEVWSSPLTSLDPLVAEQLSSTNLEYYQHDTLLYLVGGYGYNGITDEWMTHPRLTVLHVPGIIQAIQTGASLAPHVRTLEDDLMAVTGGQLGRIGDRFYLVGGQRFDGRYNPHNGPSFVQTYTDAVRVFEVDDDGTSLSLQNVEVWSDPANLHRRDYNLLPQIFPDGSFGYTLFTGVFRYDIDLPWLSTVDIHADNYALVTGFEQWFNQYHTANLAIYDSASNDMYNFFFGGIGLYYADEQGAVWIDSLVPFVNTISWVKRDANGQMSEHILEATMPGLLGASAEFLLLPETPLAGADVVDLAELPDTPFLVGYIYGGIESTQSNIFMQFSGSSEASNRIFKVYLEKGVSATSYRIQAQPDDLDLQCTPNPASEKLVVSYNLPESGALRLEIVDRQGRVVVQKEQTALPAGAGEATLSLQGLEDGLYFCRGQQGSVSQTRRLIVKRN